LAGKAARNNVNNSSPRLSVKSANVIPYRKRRENAIILSLCKYACGIGFDFNGAHGSPSKQLTSEDSASGPCEQRKLSQCSIIAFDISQLIHFASVA
jgi:hypothetical protein